MKSIKLSLGTAAALVLTAVAAGCGSSSSANTTSGGGTINLVAYSTPQAAYAKLIPAFQARRPARA